MHYYHDPHPYYEQDVLVVGGKNSAAIAALDLWRHGAHVTLVHRSTAMHQHVKYWILPDIDNRIKNGEVAAHFQSRVTSIDEDSVTIAGPEGELTIHNDYVFAMTGYHPDFDFLTALGVRMEGPDRLPGLRSGIARKQCRRRLSGRSHCCRAQNERDLYRKRPVSWAPDCIRLEREDDFNPLSS